MNESEIVKQFEGYVAKLIDAKGIFPYPMVALEHDDKLSMSALALDPTATIKQFLHLICNMNAKEVIMGLDRSTRENQGTEFADVLTCYYWKDRSEEKDLPEAQKTWDKWFKFGVINYQHDPREVRPMDWNNAFWNEKLAGDINALKPPMRIVVKKVKKNED